MLKYLTSFGNILGAQILNFVLHYASAEEQSILIGATMDDFDIDFDQTWNDLALIDGCYKSQWSS